MNLRRESMKHVASAVTALSVITMPAVGSGRTITARTNLAATSAATNAHGKAALAVHGSKSKLEVKASRLARGESFEVIANGVKVGTLRTGKSGSGRLRFRATPTSKDVLLGFEPRGVQLSVRGTDGRDVLVGTMDAVDPSAAACCIPAAAGTSACQELAADACAAAGGTANAAATCLPDPCAVSPPPAVVVCCLNETDDDESESECEHDVDTTACAAGGGTTVAAAGCEPNPCVPTAPPTGDVAACCLTHEHETECEVRTTEACSARGGTVMAGVTTCGSNPCGLATGPRDDDDDGEDGSGGDDGENGGSDD